jgi:hypothetical protein
MLERTAIHGRGSVPSERNASQATSNPSWSPLPAWYTGDDEAANGPRRDPELERKLRERLDALGPAPRAELLHVLILPDFDRADAIGSYWGNSATHAFAGLLFDCEEDRKLRAVLIGMLREG